MPAALQGIDWDEIKLFTVSGHSYKEAGEKFEIDEATIRQRSHREQWPVPERVSRIVTRVAENTNLAQKMAETWAEKGEMHRSLAFRVAKRAMEGVSELPPEVKDWADVERIDKMARRAAGLDDDSKSGNVVTLNILGEKLEIQAEATEIQAGELPE